MFQAQLRDFSTSPPCIVNGMHDDHQEPTHESSHDHIRSLRPPSSASRRRRRRSRPPPRRPGWRPGPPPRTPPGHHSSSRAFDRSCGPASAARACASGCRTSSARTPVRIGPIHVAAHASGSAIIPGDRSSGHLQRRAHRHHCRRRRRAQRSRRLPGDRAAGARGQLLSAHARGGLDRSQHRAADGVHRTRRSDSGRGVAERRHG